MQLVTTSRPFRRTSTGFNDIFFTRKALFFFHPLVHGMLHATYCMPLLHNSCPLYSTIQFVQENVWVLSHKGYGLLSIADVWVIDRVFPHTKLVTKKSHRVLRSMGYQSYGLRELRLYYLIQGGLGTAIKYQGSNFFK